MRTEEQAAPKRRSISRRSVIMGVGGIVALSALGGLKYAGADPVVRPPGGQDEDRVVGACIRCQKCYEACPRGVVKPLHVERGLVNMRTPGLSFENDYCDWCAEENDGVPLCAASCPTEALKVPAGATANNTILGKAAITYDWCLAYRNLGCRFCYDACPYDAMELDDMGRPSVIDDRCNGCGACESVCVSLKEGSISSGATARAITVQPLQS